ncbi:hypothetical protein KC19_VG110800 [Ceratodon purpureus]|uniref:Uncharacterized protein n=1 Tax=Ceratodon purpureus TaxID=3225 RepID=A0A8T0HPU8_CERPU|nr:hypothetical protein KC19_VG110800 [Ceratodon purpureus]
MVWIFCWVLLLVLEHVLGSHCDWSAQQWVVSRHQQCERDILPRWGLPELSQSSY